MGLEVATFISGLNTNNPVGATDPKSQGDDHIRLIKTTLLNTFPNILGAMNASHIELNNLVGVTGKTGTGNIVLSVSPTLTGTITGGIFSGDGSLLTALNASNLASGTVPNARIDASLINHDALLNSVANEHIDHSAVSITAGSGLTGGGTIAASRTLNVGAGDGISVAADSVAVDATVVRTTGAQTIGGDKTFSNAIEIGDDFVTSGVLGLAAGGDNISTTNAAVIRYTGGAGTITGFAGGVNGRRLTVINRGSALLQLEREDVGSTPANRFIMRSSISEKQLAVDDSVDLVYDGSSNRWQVINA